MNSEQIQASYGRCLRKRGFISRFYAKLLSRDARVEVMFRTTDWPKQQKALRRGISIALTYAGGSEFVRRNMSQMAHIHSRAGHATVAPELYQHWIEALLETVREFDIQITEDSVPRH